MGNVIRLNNKTTQVEWFYYLARLTEISGVLTPLGRSHYWVPRVGIGKLTSKPHKRLRAADTGHF